MKEKICILQQYYNEESISIYIVSKCVLCVSFLKSNAHREERHQAIIIIVNDYCKNK